MAGYGMNFHLNIPPEMKRCTLAVVFSTILPGGSLSILLRHSNEKKVVKPTRKVGGSPMSCSVSVAGNDYLAANRALFGIRNSAAVT